MARDLMSALERGPLVCDGAMGTMLMASGVKARCPEELNLISPETVRAVHAAYVEAGANVITTNSFGGSRHKLSKCDMADMAGEVNRAAARIAREAAGEDTLVAGSIGPLGELLQPYGLIGEEEALTAFEEQAQALAEGGVDFFIVETMFDLAEASAAVRAAASTGLPVMATMTFDSGGRTMMGVSPKQAAQGLRQAGATVVGANCGVGPDETLSVVREMRLAGDGLWLAAQPNAGVPVLEDGRTVYSIGPDEMARWAPSFLASGVRILGSCCGSSPEHTRAIAGAIGMGQ